MRQKRDNVIVLVLVLLGLLLWLLLAHDERSTTIEPTRPPLNHLASR